MKLFLVILAAAIVSGNAQPNPPTTDGKSRFPSCQSVRADSVFGKGNVNTGSSNRCPLVKAISDSYIRLTADVEIQPFRAIIVPGPTFEYIEILFRNENSESYNSLKVLNDQLQAKSEDSNYPAYSFANEKRNLLAVNFTKISGDGGKLKAEMTFIRKAEVNDTKESFLVVSEKNTTRSFPYQCSSKEDIFVTNSSQMHLRSKGEVSLVIFLENQCLKDGFSADSLSKTLFNDTIPEIRNREGRTRTFHVDFDKTSNATSSTEGDNYEYSSTDDERELDVTASPETEDVQAAQPMTAIIVVVVLIVLAVIILVVIWGIKKCKCIYTFLLEYNLIKKNSKYIYIITDNIQIGPCRSSTNI